MARSLRLLRAERTAGAARELLRADVSRRMAPSIDCNRLCGRVRRTLPICRRDQRIFRFRRRRLLAGGVVVSPPEGSTRVDTPERLTITETRVPDGRRLGLLPVLTRSRIPQSFRSTPMPTHFPKPLYTSLTDLRHCRSIPRC